MRVLPPFETLSVRADFVLVRRFEGLTKTPSGLLYIPPAARETQRKAIGTVEQVGPTARSGVRVGDRVIYDPTREYEVGPDVVTLPEIGVLAVIEDMTAEVIVGPGPVGA